MYNQDESTSKRISFQSIFSSLCNLHQGGKFDFSQLEDIAHEINKRLHEIYPCEKTNLPPQSMMNQQAKEVDGFGKVKIKICPVPDCGQPMVRQYNKKNPKAPDWKCSDKNCKYKKSYSGGWSKSEFITGAWDEKEEDVRRAAREDSVTDEANNPPEEYGGSAY